MWKLDFMLLQGNDSYRCKGCQMFIINKNYCEVKSF